MKENKMPYREARQFLARHTQLIELTDDRGARVAVCPEWVGRVMTSTCGGLDGPSFGFVNRPFIEAGRPDERFSNYGGEERMWLSPEGGQFSLWFKPDEEQIIDNWCTPRALNDAAWTVISDGDGRDCRMATSMSLQNASAAQFDLDVSRHVRLLGLDELRRLFGDSAAELLGDDGVKTVGYETANTITNRGAALTEEKGLVSIWVLGMLNAGPRTVVIVPYKSGDGAELGPVVKSDYFGQIPPERLNVTPEAILFTADGKYRSKIGTSQWRARNVLGAIDFGGETLTVAQFTMPPDPAKCTYMNNMWEVPQAEPYIGDVANSYNDGPNERGEQLGAFYEVESLSQADALATDESLTHRHRTIHVQADSATLAELAKEILGVELATVRNVMGT